MAHVLIIGYGNPLRQDDGFGWQAAQQCVSVLPPAQAKVIACHQLTPELAEIISRASLVIFLDADTEQPPGRLSCRWIVAEPSVPAAFSHRVTPQSLLACAQALYGSHPAAVMLSISGASFGYSEALSPAVNAAMPEVLERVRALVATVEPGQRSMPHSKSA
jgi:hydrogenase maturation protease